MKTEKIKNDVMRVLSSDVASVRCCGKTYDVSGMCLLLLIALIMSNTALIVCMERKAAKLKEKAKAARGDCGG